MHLLLLALIVGAPAAYAGLVHYLRVMARLPHNDPDLGCAHALRRADCAECRGSVA